MSEEEQAPEEEVTPQEEQQTDDIEERARTMGWVPKEEFRGDESRWVDAEEFVRKGAENIPILRERYDKLEKKYHELEKTLKQFARHHEEVSEREYKKAIDDVRKQKAEAVSLGDADAYSKAEAQEDQLREKKPKSFEIEDTPDEHPDWSGWLADNQWYEQDNQARDIADAIGQKMINEGTKLEGRAFFDAVKEKVKQAMPHKFENSRRSQPAAVEGGGGKPSKSKAKSYENLPPDAKAACDRFVKQGLMTKEQYVKEFDWS